MNQPVKSILYAHIASTLLMTGVIWIIQVVHYPLFDRVGEANFRAYEATHTNLITLVVFPLMTVELVTAFLLVMNRPPGVPGWVVLAGLGLVLAIWGVTAFISVPLHNQLGRGFSAEAHQLLVSTNWLRTIGWSARSVLVFVMLDMSLRELAEL